MSLLVYAATTFAQGEKIIEAASNIFGYGGIEAQFGNYLGAAGSINCIWHRNVWSLSASYGSRDAANIPADYSGKAPFTVGNGEPKQTLIMVSAMYGCALPSQMISVRYILKSGISAGVVQRPQDYTPSQGFSLTSGPNYTYTTSQRTAIGFVLNPVIEFPFSKGMGISLSCTANINTVSSSYTGNVGILFGRLRKNSLPH